MIIVFQTILLNSLFDLGYQLLGLNVSYSLDIVLIE
jgi:hypothetical protein